MMEEVQMTRGEETGRYPLRVYFDEETEEWIAEVVDLPGCVGVGDSPGEAVEVAGRFVADWIEMAKERGEAVPEPRGLPSASGKFVARVPRSLHARLQERAEIEGTSLNQLVVRYLAEGLRGDSVMDVFDARVASLAEKTAAASLDVLKVLQGLGGWTEAAQPAAYVSTEGWLGGKMASKVPGSTRLRNLLWRGTEVTGAVANG